MRVLDWFQAVSRRRRLGPEMVRSPGRHTPRHPGAAPQDFTPNPREIASARPRTDWGLAMTVEE